MSAASILSIPSQFEFVLPASLGLAPGAEAWIPFGESRVRLVVGARNDRAPVEESAASVAPMLESMAAGPDGDRI